METTGLSARTDRILEVAVVLTDARGWVQHEWTTRVNPQCAVGATHIHGITADDVAHAPTFDQLVPHLTSMLRGRAVVAHNAKFDLGFLRWEYGRANWSWPQVPAMCTLEQSWHFLPHLDRRRLPDCCWASGITLDGAHSALGDARATATLLASYLDPAFGRPPLPEHHALLAPAGRVTWPDRPGVGRIPDPTGPVRRAPRPGVNFTRALRVATLLETFTLSDALDEGAPSQALPYLEMLAEALEDGELSAAEQVALNDVAELYELDGEALTAAHRGFLRALAREALEDGKVTRAEKTELLAVAELLGGTPGDVNDLLDGEEERRLGALSHGLAPLPDPWDHGEPLRVGHRVVFTGCEDHHREHLEAAAQKAGVRVLGAVSSRTAMLVSDGTMEGTKAEAARRLGTRVVHPTTFAVLLAHLQPVSRSGRPERHAPTPAAFPAAHTTATIGERAAAPGHEPVAGPAISAVPPADVRAWARANGIPVGTRGRLPAELVDAYQAAHLHE
ncbi:histone-like nucleoid-structuring protein Lsr2 [Angustibacter sp. Root456]|uniref:exonuclease domain-containing protein n=1 Tax=Angustibacter sp. Root456 TaxID=1736539 RepID=UPI0006F6DB58|nr:histone-like nucleoid-structuring protein Lsr2 [Angustibacter sp. Root456]KQX64503.1 hypothetical protein ASD06_10105 [Angustibacter sp. Root456]